MKNITVSAPGKLMLFGEHAVVYNHPCLVTSVDQRINAIVEKLEDKEFQLDAQDVKVTGYKKSLTELGKGDIPKGAQFVEIALKNISEKYRINFGLKITTISEFSSQFGFGSSSASTVCTVKGVTDLMGLNLTSKEIFDISFKTVLNIQGKGSGFDVAAAVFGGTLYFFTGGKIVEPILMKELPIIVGYSGVKADTVTLINKVKEKFEPNPKRLEEIYAEIEILVNKAKKALTLLRFEEVGKIMNENQNLLNELGVSTPKLNSMIKDSLDAGAYGAKLSGAGGGDCIISIAPKAKVNSIKNAIKNAGGQVIEVKANTEGVKIE